MSENDIDNVIKQQNLETDYAALAQKAMYAWQIDTIAPPLMLMYRDMTPLKRADVIALSIQKEILPNGFTNATAELRYAIHKRTLEVALDLYDRGAEALQKPVVQGEGEASQSRNL